MERTLGRDLRGKIGSSARVRGWLNNVRSLGKVNFLILRDRTGLIQIVVDKGPEFDAIQSLQPGAILSIDGLVVASTQVELGAEIVSPHITVEVPVREIPPVEFYKPHLTSDLETQLDHRPVALRHRQSQAIFVIQAEIAHAYRLYMHDTVGAVEYFAPNMIGASSEGGAEFFKIDYFGHTATLAQSSQLYKQIMVGVNERVFGLMPFFRAENSNTTRHLTEAKQLEFEMGFFETWHEVMDIEEGAIKYIVQHLHKHCATELATLGTEMVLAPANVPFPRVTFAQAQQIYFERTGTDERREPDLSPAAERALCQYARENFGTDLIFVTDWLTSKRPFYSYPTDGAPTLTNTFDLLCGGTEITSGGQRRHTYDSMVDGIVSKGMDPANFEDYLSIFKHGMPPHGGFGLGLERLTMTLLGLKNIREASLFPSDPKRIAGKRLHAPTFIGGENVRNEILRLLKKNNAVHQHLVHEPTPTSEDSARVRGTTLAEGVKSIILKGKSSKKNFHCNIPSNLKLDMKAVAEVLGEKCEFEDPEIITGRFGLAIGGVPPFGSLLGLETLFDERVTSEPRAAFNCGLKTESIVMSSKDLLSIVEGKVARIAKE